MARPDGPVAARRRLHLRLDREPARARHAQRRSRPARVPAPSGRRHDRLRLEPDAARAGRARARPRLALRGRELGLDLRARGAGRRNEVDQPKPLPSRVARGATRHAADGTRLPRDGAPACCAKSSGFPSGPRNRRGRTTTYEQDQARCRDQPERRDRSARRPGRQYELEQRHGITEPLLERAKRTVPMVGGDESTLAHEGDDGQAQPAVNGRDGARGRNPGTACF